MRHEIKTNNKKFEPIYISIRIETKRELIELVSRLDVSTNGLLKNTSNSYGLKLEDDHFESLWEDLDGIYEKVKHI